MFSNKLEQEGGENSTNNQAGRDLTINNYQGISYSDAKEIALDVFKENYIVLSSQAAEIAKQRVNEIVEKLLTRLYEGSPNSIKNIIDPGIQAAIYSAQKTYAQSGNSDLENLLVELLLERIQTNLVSLDQLIINECIEKSSKLTPAQLDLLSITYLLKYVYNNIVNSLGDLEKYIKDIYFLFLNESYNSNDVRHLFYTGCSYLLDDGIHLLAQFMDLYRKLFICKFNETTIAQLSNNQIVFSEFVSLTIPSDILGEIIVKPSNTDNPIEIIPINVFSLKRALVNKGMDIEKNSLFISWYNKLDIDGSILSTFSFLLDDYNNFEYVWEKLKLKQLELTLVGEKLALMNIKAKMGLTFNHNLFVPIYEDKELLQIKF